MLSPSPASHAHLRALLLLVRVKTPTVAHAHLRHHCGTVTLNHFGFLLDCFHEVTDLLQQLARLLISGIKDFATMNSSKCFLEMFL
jgi:hypothetical protein